METLTSRKSASTGSRKTGASRKFLEEIKDQKVVAVFWADAYSVQSWSAVDKALDLAPIMVLTQGILVEAKKTHVTVALSYTEHGHVGDFIRIPRENVRKMYVMNVGAAFKNGKASR